MILLEFFFFLTRALKTPWWTGLVLCALFRACSDYFFHTIRLVSSKIGHSFNTLSSFAVTIPLAGNGTPPFPPFLQAMLTELSPAEASQAGLP